MHRALHSLKEGDRCQLFRREDRNLTPTDAAHVLANYASDLLKLVGGRIRATREGGGFSSGNIRFGSLYSLAVATVPHVIVDLKLRKPELQTELIPGSNADLFW